AAARARDDRILATIWTELIHITGTRLAKPADALALEPVALAAVERAGADPELGAVLLGILADVLHTKGDSREAVERSRQAIERFEKLRGPDDAQLAVLLNNHGKFLAAMERYDESRAHYDRAMAIHEKVYGPEHPSVGLVLINI